ncbi:hypothetical protein [Oceanobacillus caeni]|uniref:Uncharacterized protein n=1 Tax=Oceanobacillus caeni TaxID=405946 RepID=A0ABR5MK05_9BACI|nr:hypothetical protein [Oceanobacillus caeni]KPH76054.1 hypothetical protein AFL42_07025 [Oceanobacillus caeni]
MYYYFVIGLISGLFFGYLICSFTHLVKKGINIKLFGYELNIQKNDRIEVIEPKKKYRKLQL